MDPRLLRLYSDELGHLREVGAEFAREFPKIAARLGLQGTQVDDPYVERLLEGFAFLAARVQLKLESEQPRLIAHLLESLYPNFLAPVPSMMVARFQVDSRDPNLLRGLTVPRGSAIRAELARGQDTRCEFRSAHAVTLWPIELAGLRYFSHDPELPTARLPQAGGAKGGLRMRLRSGGGTPIAQLGIERLAFYISAADDVAFRLHEQVIGQTIGSWIAPADPALAASQWRDAASVRPLGFEAGEALLPETLRSFSGHRLLQELAALPQRFLFFEIGELGARLARVSGDEAELVLLFDRGDPGLEAVVDAHSLALHCTPAINLFEKRLDRIALGPDAWEHHVVPDRTRPMDYEVHSLASVVGFGTGRVQRQPFVPLYANVHATMPAADENGDGAGYYTVRREPRLLSPRQHEQGTRSSYVGEEVYLSLVDPRHAPYREEIRQLAVSAWVSNRDLPTLLPVDGAPDAPALWRLDAPGPVLRTQALRGPTRPVTRRPMGELGWSLVSRLALNHLPLTDAAPERAAAALRAMLALYGLPQDPAWMRQVDGTRALRSRTVVRRLPHAGPICFATGVEFELELDEFAFQGTSAFLFAAVLERCLARHAAINGFAQLALRTPQRGRVMHWPARVGVGELV
jgi:type VI secretion system protein ImpG